MGIIDRIARFLAGIAALAGISGLVAYGIGLAFLTPFFSWTGPNLVDVIRYAPQLLSDARFYMIWGGIAAVLAVVMSVSALKDRFAARR